MELKTEQLKDYVGLPVYYIGNGVKEWKIIGSVKYYKDYVTIFFTDERNTEIARKETHTGLFISV